MVDETEVELREMQQNKPRKLQKFRQVTLNSSRTVEDSILEASAEDEEESEDSDEESEEEADEI